MGIALPSISDSNFRSAKLATSSERKDRVRNAHAAIRKRGRSKITTVGELEKKRDSLFYVGIGEIDVVSYLQARGISVTQQALVDQYNIDVLVSNVAVEIHRSTARPTQSTQRLRRIVKLLRSGYHVVYIWFRPDLDVSHAAIDQLIAFLEGRSGNPTATSQYLVIRSDGEIDHTSNRHLDDITSEVALYRSQDRSS